MRLYLRGDHIFRLRRLRFFKFHSAVLSKCLIVCKLSNHCRRVWHLRPSVLIISNIDISSRRRNVLQSLIDHHHIWPLWSTLQFKKFYKHIFLYWLPLPFGTHIQIFIFICKHLDHVIVPANYAVLLIRTPDIYVSFHCIFHALKNNICYFWRRSVYLLHFNRECPHFYNKGGCTCSTASLM